LQTIRRQTLFFGYLYAFVQPKNAAHPEDGFLKRCYQTNSNKSQFASKCRSLAAHLCDPMWFTSHAVAGERYFKDSSQTFAAEIISHMWGTEPRSHDKLTDTKSSERRRFDPWWLAIAALLSTVRLPSQ